MPLGFLRRPQEWLSRSFRVAPRSGDIMLWILRGSFAAIIIGLAYRRLDYMGKDQPAVPAAGLAAFLAVLGVGVGVVALDLLVRNKQITTISAVYFGLLLGMLLGTLF